MKPIFTTLLVLFISSTGYSENQPEHVICGTPNAEFNNSTHLVPFMKLEKEGDHVKVTVFETESEGPISENLYPYYIPELYVNEGIGTFYGTAKNYSGGHSDFEVDQDGFLLRKPSRLGFATEPGKLIPLSDSYNQVFLMWGEHNLVNFSFDPKGEDYFGFQYYSPYNEQMNRVVGGTYYCPYRKLDGLLWSLYKDNLVTSYEPSEKLSDLDSFYNPLAFEFTLQQYVTQVICSGDVIDTYTGDGEQFNNCPNVKYDLLWVLFFMEEYNHEFDFEKLKTTTIYVDDVYYEQLGWQVEKNTGREYLVVHPEFSKRELMQFLKKEVSGIEEESDW